MATLNDFRETCKAIDGMVLPFLAAVIILYWLLHDGHEHRQIENKLDALQKHMSRVDGILSSLNEHVKNQVTEQVENGRHTETTVEARD